MTGETPGTGRILADLIAAETQWSEERRSRIEARAAGLVTLNVSLVGAFVLVIGVVAGDDGHSDLRGSSGAKALLAAAGFSLVVSAVLASVALLPRWFPRTGVEGLKEYLKPENYDNNERFLSRRAAELMIVVLAGSRRANRTIAWWTVAAAWAQILGIGLATSAVAVLSFS